MFIKGGKSASTSWPSVDYHVSVRNSKTIKFSRYFEKCSIRKKKTKYGLKERQTLLKSSQESTSFPLSLHFL